MKTSRLLFIAFAILTGLRLQAQNNALKFGNSNPQDYVQIGYNAGLNLGTAPFTIEAQVRLSPTVSNAQTIISNRTFTMAADGYWIYINANGKLAFTLGGFSITGIGNDLRDSVCHQVALSRNSSNVVTVYVDGVFQSGYSVSNNLTSTMGHPIWLGKDDFDPSVSHFEGAMDEVRIWNTARTAAQVDSFKNIPVSTSATGLLAYYQFNQGTAGANNTSIFAVPNSTSSNYSGTLVNFTLNGNASNFVSGCGTGCTAFAGNDTSLCTGKTLLLNPTPAGGTYTDNGNAFSGYTYTAVSTGLHTLVYSTPGGCKDTMQLIVRANPNLGPDKSICKNDSISFPPPNAANQVSYTDNGNSFLSVFYGNTPGSHVIIANAAGCRDTVVITVKDTCNVKICDYFKPDVMDSNCCRTGITRNLAGGPNVVAVRYQVTGGVIQGYTTNCPGSAPTSVALSGTASGLVTFSPSCGNLQLFNTSLQSTTSVGSMTVSFTVKYANGDSCKYTIAVNGCPRAPQTSCDKIKVVPCICTGSLLNYLNINITNNAIPGSPICNVIITKYTSGNVVDPTFFTNGVIAPGTFVPGPNSNLAIFPATVVNTGNSLGLQLFYPNNTPFTGYIRITVIHCNGDTCKYTWGPKIFLPSEAGYINYGLAKGVNPYARLYAYTLRITGPSQVPSGTNPYKVKYVSLSVADSGNVLIAACTGAEQFFETDKINRLRMSLSSHSRKNAFFELLEPLTLQPKDSSDILQVIFANKLPGSIAYNFYDEEGNMMKGGSITVDTTTATGVVKLGKSSSPASDPVLINGYPNPTTGMFTCKINLPQHDLISLLIMDIEGREVYRKDMGALNAGLSDLSLDLSHLQNGNYFISASCKSSGTTTNAMKIILVK